MEKLKDSLLNKITKLYENDDDGGVDVLSIKIDKRKPPFVIDKNKQYVEWNTNNFLLSKYEYVQQTTGYLGDDYYGHIARKFKFINLWVIIEYEC